MFKNISVDKIIVTLLDSVHARLCKVSFEELLEYFVNCNASAVYAFIIEYNKLVESIQNRIKKNFGLKFLFKLTVKALKIREESVAAFLDKIIDFAIDSSQKANYLRCQLQTLKKDKLKIRLIIKERLVPEYKIQFLYINTLKSKLLNKKSDNLRSFIAEILIRKFQFARDKITLLTNILR